MRLNLFSFFLLGIVPFCLLAQPGTVNMTPVQSLNLNQVAVELPAKFNGKFPAGKTLKIPAGYKVKVFYAGGLGKPRFMSFDPQGVLHVADQVNNVVYAMPDKNNDGVADTSFIAASGFLNCHDVKFYKGAMYVTEATRVWKCVDTNADGVYESKSIFINNIGAGAASGGHSTRTIVFDSINQKIYLSIGSSCNVCRESLRATIEEYNDDGTGKRTYASGIRNAVGMALHPANNKLWANNNGSDNQGNEIPPEWIDIIRDGGFYGHPFAYGNQVWSNFSSTAHNDYKALLPITATDSTKVKLMIEPAALIRAHSAPMALTFLNSSFPNTMRNGMLSALRGSWNSPQSFRGYKVVYLDLNSPGDTTVNYVADFIDGFLTDTINRVYWGRPVGLLADKAGNIYLSSDETNKFILKISPEFANGIEEKENHGFNIFPNPGKLNNSELTVKLSENYKMDSKEQIRVINMLGETLFVTNLEKEETIINISSLAPGLYFIRIGESFQKFVKE